MKLSSYNTGLKIFKKKIAGREILDYYLLSLATVDLILGSLIGPLSLYAAVIGDWIYGDLLCRLMGYLEISLWIVTIYTFMWISVDRYLSIKKPFRYDVLQTKTRSQCWMVFTWISALMICSPPLLNYHKPLYDHESFLCYLDWSDMVAYAVTLSILVLGPSLMTIIFCYAYILRVLKKLQRADPMIMHDKELASALSENISNPSHLMTTILILVFWLSWMPYIVVNCYEFFFRVRFQIPFLHFIVAWLGVLNSFWKLLILLLFSARFRVATRIFCLRLCCQSRNQFHDQLVDFDFDMEFDEFHNS